ncbi:hypothetical protein IL38_04720 [Actinopolyspora erythraea]|uniref:Transposase n=1 Tax=Actinopolyspora erythraea TaxID=414996 RepID=A0ABR4X6T4_9ACTN|nr:hypothetical protein IL38_04720 [Actinopolyspora erythraea]
MRYQDITGLSEDQLCWLAGRVGDHIRWDPRNKLSMFTALVVTMEYCRIHLTQKQLAALHGTSQSTISRVLERIEPVLAEVVECFCLDPDDIGANAALIDGFLIPTGNRRDQHGLYSGKHRRHGIRAYTITDLDGTVLATSEVHPGATHDLTVFRSSSWYWHLNHPNTIGDLGLSG